MFPQSIASTTGKHVQWYVEMTMEDGGGEKWGRNGEEMLSRSDKRRHSPQLHIIMDGGIGS